MNTLYYGDNITIMHEKMGKDAVDLIYLDPPFKSDENYNLLYKKLTGKPVPEQIVAFTDTWTLDDAKEQVARTMPVLMREHGVPDYYVDFWRLWMNALRHTNKELLAYLIYMVQRLLYMKTILRPTGSIYLHCDPAASHYIKVMMDAIFGHENFRNEIAWKRAGSHGSSKRWEPVHDTILFYTKTDKYTWNKIVQPYEAGYIEMKYRCKDVRGLFQDVSLTGVGVRRGDSGKPWRGHNPTEKGRHWAIPTALGAEMLGFKDMSTQEKLEALDAADLLYWPRGGDGFPRLKQYPGKGVPIQDVITDISAINSQAEERLGYPTQKPKALIDRIIQASSNQGDIVFDPFCGCGTTIYSAIANDRQWKGCDIAILPIRLVAAQLASRCRLVQGVHFEIDGVPVSVEQAEHLFRRDPFQFQHWLVERVGGFPMMKKVADKGIDGRMYFETREGLKEVLLSVKGGNLRPSDVRDLHGVLERERAAIAGFLSLKEPSKSMREEAARAGSYLYQGISYPRLQLLTVQEILEGKRDLHTPTKVSTKIVTGQGALAL
ncbi:MAG: site-specific DNA-methyltransferase [Geminicoccaceae bacterium]|nr:site-specific DNA-methyltransferase [Geminicoccaceae bacterium]